MAIVSLGTFAIATNSLETAYNSFPYNQRRAYGIYVLCTSPAFNNIFSFLRIRAQIEPNGLIPFRVNDPYELDIVPNLQFFYLPMSRLFDNNGDCTLLVERPPIFRGGGDRTDVTVELSYDDQVDVPSWRD